MGLKEQVMELVCMADHGELDALVRRDSRAVRHLLGRLWDPHAEHRQTAAAALAAAADEHPDIGADLARRLIWALNDESAMNGVYGLPALGEIGARAPLLFEAFVGPMASFMWDDGLRLEILRALTKIAAHHPQLIEPARGILEDFAETQDPEERALVAALLAKRDGERDEA
jgi:hypothetical protein